MSQLIIENDLDAFLAFLEGVDENDDESFAVVIAGTVLHANALGDYGIVDRLAPTIGVGRAAVRRYILGKNSPHPVVRKLLYAALKALLETIREEAVVRDAEASRRFREMNDAVNMIGVEETRKRRAQEAEGRGDAVSGDEREDDSAS